MPDTDDIDQAHLQSLVDEFNAIDRQQTPQQPPTSDPVQEDRSSAIMEAVDRAHGAGALTADHVLDIRRVLADAHDAVEPPLSSAAQWGLDRAIAAERNGGTAPYDWDYGEAPAAPVQRREMTAYARWLANKEPTGSADAEMYDGLAERIASSKTPISVPANPPPPEEEHQPREGLLLRELPGGGVEFKPWAAIKGFMESEPGSPENVRHAFDIASTVAGASAARAGVAREAAEVPLRLMGEGGAPEVAAGAGRRLSNAELEDVIGVLNDPVSYTPEFLAKAPDVAASIEADLGQILPDDVAARVLPQIRESIGGQTYDLRGKYDPVHRLLEVATEGGHDPLGAARHETIHALRDVGLFTDKEWATLVDAANKGGIDAETYDNYKKLYAGRSNLNELLDQEMVAHLAEAWRGGTRYGGTVDALLQRIHEFMASLRNGLAGNGFTTPDQILTKVFSGQIARRGNTHG